jgi:hypothetical protein
MQDQIMFFDNLTIKPGIRSSFYSGNKKVYFEPRFAANYKFTEKFSTRASVGRYYQFLSQALALQETGYTKSFWVLADNDVHPVLQSTHYIIGSTYEIDNFLFDVEAYRKNYTGLQEYIYISQFLKNSDFPNYFPQNNPTIPNVPNVPNVPNNQNNNLMPNAPNPPPSYFIKGDGKSYGVDFFLRYKFRNYSSWLSYSLSKSLRQFTLINNGAETPAPTDQLHQISWSNMISVGKWNFGTTTLFTSGRPYIDFATNGNDYLTTRHYKRLPNYSRSDISANYNFLLGPIKMKIGATIVNIFNTQNFFDINIRKFDFQNASFSETNLIRSQQRSLNLFLHFLL